MTWITNGYISGKYLCDKAEKERASSVLPPLSGLTDAAGVVHQPAEAPFRIVSLVPSITELLFDLGLGGDVVGRTAFCVHPKGGLRGVPSVGGTKSVRFEKLQASAPTHVIVNIDETPRAVADRLVAAGYRVIVTHPVEVSDNIGLYRLIGGIFGRRTEAEHLVAAFREAFAELPSPRLSDTPLRVLYLIWKDPWMTVSRETYISRMLSLIDWQTVPERSEARYPSVELDEALRGGIGRILFSSEPFPFKDRHVAEFGQAFPHHAGKARLVDGQLLSWYGSRAILGLRYLTRLAHGEA